MSCLTPAIIFTGTKLDVSSQRPVPLGHMRLSTMPNASPINMNLILTMESSIILPTLQHGCMDPWPTHGCHYASPSDFGILPNTNVIFRTLSPYHHLLKRVHKYQFVIIYRLKRVIKLFLKIKNYATFPQVRKIAILTTHHPTSNQPWPRQTNNMMNPC